MTDQARNAKGRGLHQLVQLYPAPEYVKEASANDLFGTPDLPVHVYADPRHRQYACHTPAATWASYGFFLQKKAEYRPHDAQAIVDRFSHYATYHNISAQLREMEELYKRASHFRTVEELPNDDFAFVLQTPEGQVERHCAMRNGLEVVKAAEYLLQHRDVFPFEVRQDAADRILNKASSLGVLFEDKELEHFLDKQAGHGMCTAKDLAELIVDRVHAGRKGPGALSEKQAELLKFAKVCVQKPSQVREPGILVKIAGVLDQYDREVGIAGQYGDKLPRIEDVLFGLTREKMASVAKDHCSTITGCIYKMADLERLKVRDVEAGLGTDFADAVTGDGIRVDAEKMAAIIPTLPRGDAELFDRLMEDLGVMPIAREKAAMATKISKDYLREMADNYRQQVGQGPKKGPRPDGLLAKFSRAS